MSPDGRHLLRTACLAAALSGTACETEDWRNADLQLEIEGASLDNTTVVRICVDDVGSQDAALGAGRVAFTGLPPQGEMTVTVDAIEQADTGLDATLIGRAGPVVFADGVASQTTTWSTCTNDCTPCRQPDVAVDAAETRLLGVRFRDTD